MRCGGDDGCGTGADGGPLRLAWMRGKVWQGKLFAAVRPRRVQGGLRTRLICIGEPVGSRVVRRAGGRL